MTGGGSICSGGSGVAVGLSGSQAGVSYQLRKDNVNTGSPVAGTGSALSFGSQAAAGTYTVTATHGTGGCAKPMAGSVAVTVNALPNLYTVTGGGSICSGGSGVAVGLSGSQTGVSYQLKRNNANVGSPVAGTGSSLSFGGQATGGTYTVTATASATSCARAMTGSATVTVNPLPVAYAMTGGGGICGEGAGVAVGLSGSQTGVSYQLRRNNSNAGAALTGSGGALSFGSQTQAGTYTVMATATGTGCARLMSGSATVTVNPVPTATITASRSTTLCAGETVTLTAGAASSYLWSNGATTQSITVGASGGYSVTVYNAQGCQATSAAVQVTANPRPVDAAITASATQICLGQAVTISVSGGTGTPYFWGDNMDTPEEWDVFQTAYGGQTSFSHTPTQPGTYRYHVRNSNSCGFCWDNGGTCHTSNFVDVTVVATPTVSVSTQGGRGTKPGVELVASGIGAASFQWYPALGLSSTVGASVNASPLQTTTYTVTATGAGDCTAQATVTVPGNDYNYVTETTVLREGYRSAAGLAGADADSASRKVTYFNGLGWGMQTVLVQASPNKKDIVTPVTYDAFGRPDTTYLPYVNGAGGLFQQGAVAAQGLFYSQAANPDPLTIKDSRPYAVAVYEASPLGKVTKQGAPGLAWQPDADPAPVSDDHTVKPHQRANAAGEVRLWRLDAAIGLFYTQGHYAAGELLVSETRDENHAYTVEYKDKDGRVLMKKVQEYGAISSTVPELGFLVTQYLYDIYGNLRLVIQPEGYATHLPAAANGRITLERTFTDLWCFRYEYDAYRRLSEKRVPGAGAVEMVYNKLGQPVLQRDAEQALKGRWSLTKYDALGRPVMAGELADTTGRAGMQAAADAFPSQTGKQLHEERNTTALGYTLDKSFPAVGDTAKLLSVTYYDDYTHAALSGLAFTPESGYASTDAIAQVRGQATGSKVRVLGTSTWLTSVTYFDEDYQPIQAISQNYLGGTDRATTVYDFAGKALSSKATHTAPTGTVVTAQRMAYDHAGRLTEAWQKMDGDPEVLLARHRYNALGQLVDKGLHSRDSLTFIQSVDFRYNIRGWLTHINNRDLNNDEVTNDDGNDKFGMELKYNTDLEVGGGQAQFNGNIAEMLWKSGGDAQLRAYAYTYDAANRLKDGLYKALGGSGWDQEVDQFSVTGLTYDGNGNIKGMRRNGLTSHDAYASAGKTFGQVDSLRYAYAGNRLRAVDDASTATGGAGDFRDNNSKQYNTAVWEYGYDANGNMTSDANKGIGKVRYNLLNLPDSVHMGATKGYIKYTYAADGRKLRKAVYATGSSAPVVTDYAGGYVYERDTLRFAHTGEGRALHTPDKDNKWRYEYHLKDHLGNLRVSVAEAASTTMMASMEPSQAQTEEASFEQVGETRHLDRGRSRSGSHAALLGLNGRQLGPTTRVTLQRGDSLRAVAHAMYAKPNDKTNAAFTAVPLAVGSLGAAGAAAIGESAGGKLRKYAPYLGVGLALAPVLNGRNNKEPKAFLVYSVYDRDSVLVASGRKPVTEEAKEGWEKLELGYLAEQDGFAEVSVVSYEPMGLWFDDIEVTASEPEIVQENHYDPWGLNLAGIEKANAPDHKFQYNGKEKQEELGLNWLDYGARMYDAQLGRWHAIDLMADIAPNKSPFHFVSNNPINRIDPTGLTDFKINETTGAVEQVGDSNNDATDRVVQTDKNGNVKRKGEGFLGFLVKDKNVGKAKTAFGGIEKGILENGRNFKNEDEVISVGGEGQPSVDGVKSFTLQLSEYLRKEIKGFSYSSDGSGNVTDMVLGNYSDNTFMKSYGSVSALQKKYGDSFSFNNVLQEFHTHPDGKLGATQSAPHLSDDVDGLQRDKPLIPNASFIILYKISGQKRPEEYNYTHEYIPKK
ncbi:DUF6443 domain-containing protein [Rufibacter sp. LB8]|uniref:DUF6443 domain-containing protein n=1 Tax=Rufibacter sp. LB8 TaxID=2777781 RepID=UPI00178C4196|nr:DUF6443 domain-containing protein [Rufibacter sp. LB8]